MGDPGGAAPPYCIVDDVEQIAEAVAEFGVRTGRPVLVCVGGASGMTDDHRARVEVVVRDALFPTLDRHRAAVVDGGTDAGIMRIMGDARVDTATAVPLIGVAAVGTVRVPEREPTVDQPADLEPHHTGVVLVPGAGWGDESAWLADVAGVVADGRPAVTLVINGGTITVDDVENSLARGRAVVVVAGTGRTADAIATAAAERAAGRTVHDARLAAIAASPLLRVVGLDRPASVVAALDAAFTPRGSPRSASAP